MVEELHATIQTTPSPREDLDAKPSPLNGKVDPAVSDFGA